MKAFTIIAMFLALSSCASKPPPPQKGFELPIALSEVFRGGVLKGLQEADSAQLGMPSQYDLVEHTCTSGPIYDLWGRYVRTDVRCW